MKALVYQWERERERVSEVGCHNNIALTFGKREQKRETCLSIGCRLTSFQEMRTICETNSCRPMAENKARYVVIVFLRETETQNAERRTGSDH